jgi:hypothetical protein
LYPLRENVHKKRGLKPPFKKALSCYCFTLDVALEFETSLDTFLRIVQVPLDLSNVNATQELLDSHKAWQASRFLNFLEVFTVAILPLSNIFSLVSKTISAEKAGIASKKVPRIVNLDILIILIPYVGVDNVYTANILRYILTFNVCTVYIYLNK